MRTSILIGVMSIILLAGGLASVRGGELDLGIVDPITPVGRITPVGPLDKVNTPDEKLRALGENKYVACWTWDMVEEKKWRCTQTYGDPKATYEFTQYQNTRYGGGQAVFVAVDAKSWDNPELRKKMMDRFQQEVIPSALERAARKADAVAALSATRAELLRLRSKQVKLVVPEWVNAKPELPKGVKVSDAKPSQIAAYDDDAIIKPAKSQGLQLAGTRWNGTVIVRQPNAPTSNVNLDLLAEQKASVMMVTVVNGKEYRHSQDGTWRLAESNRVTISMNKSGTLNAQSFTLQVNDKSMTGTSQLGDYTYDWKLQQK